MFVYRSNLLFKFWRQHGEHLCRDLQLPPPEWKCPPKVMRKQIASLMQHDSDKDVADVLWWVHVVWMCRHDERYKLLGDEMYWVFDTPEHPFEQFLVKQLLDTEEIHAYAAYATEYPATPK